MTTSPLANLSATRDLLDEFGLATKHRLGQNFLIDNHVIEHICELAELTGSERVLEVGPGIGTLTLALVQEAARVVSIEMDATLEPVLDAHAADHPNFRYIMGDALKVSPATIAEVAGGEPTVLVANLPYNVAATIILQYFETMPSLRRAVVMVQKEVADRIAAVPGTKAYGAYTVKLGLYGAVTGRFEVPPRCFMPAPHVDSAVVRIDRREVLDAGTNAPGEGAAATPLDAERVTHVVDAAFAQRRKTIRNSMGSNGFDKALLDQAFAAANIAPGARAETLSLTDFVRLARAYDEAASGLADTPAGDTDPSAQASACGLRSAEDGR
ncbi:16S rRNA (adenine(1518)-N(6)/adenine(1519)-N(6))-dimethyltransferase RsmA [Collinsella sp. An2]|uniref:16S rRNA (adenine(1518)-N(6)/adenine(1519)-N(6))- dimethyltransferase RsmA n=1 Tax=Collinsella sp. An2 TaxID=1965585 RepID=UPI000B384F52|nr:16S rRNA (adenine(1518)-N(6)/adenine(1519)-N(6))-dimethyltransferase RsmA [Collinsella sp. An2]OUP07425.1 16S rRNA (adenine(1518)-N(6)/adenine(1519)-N(6))-dimethyltransferase [Collinsella sp. An2]